MWLRFYTYMVILGVQQEAVQQHTAFFLWSIKPVPQMKREYWVSEIWMNCEYLYKNFCNADTTLRGLPNTPLWDLMISVLALQVLLNYSTAAPLHFKSESAYGRSFAKSPFSANYSRSLPSFFILHEFIKGFFDWYKAYCYTIYI